MDGIETTHKSVLETGQREKSSSKVPTCFLQPGVFRVLTPAVITQSSEQINQLLKCLLTADQFQPALSMYRERLLEALKVR